MNKAEPFTQTASGDHIDLLTLAQARPDRCRWLAHESATLPPDIWRFAFPDDATAAAVKIAMAHMDFETRKTLLHTIRTARMYIDSPPMSTRLPFSYQAIPGVIRRLVARVIGRWRRREQRKWAQFPSFPMDLTADALSDILLGTEPIHDPTPVILTHDIDSMQGERNLRHFMEIEEVMGARSTNFVVPFKWRLDHSFLEEVKKAGHEIGVHGFNHANQTPYLPATEIRKRFDQTRPFMERYRCRGYRAPTLLRTRALLKALAEYFEYDSSVPTSGGLFPVPNNGCASARPFRAEGVWEIPISLPRDAGLMFLGHGPGEIEKQLLDGARRLRASGGVAVLLTHCEKVYSGNRTMLDLYRRVLSTIKEDDGFRFMTMSAYYDTYLKDRH